MESSDSINGDIVACSESDEGIEPGFNEDVQSSSNITENNHSVTNIAETIWERYDISQYTKDGNPFIDTRDSKQYRVQSYGGKHKGQYSVIELRDGVEHGDAYFYDCGLLTRRWTMVNGNYEGTLLLISEGKLVKETDWSVIASGNDIIRWFVYDSSNTKLMRLEDAKSGNIVYLGEFEGNTFERHGYGIEFNRNNGEVIRSGKFINNTFMACHQQFIYDSRNSKKKKMIEYDYDDLESARPQYNRPVYIGGYMFDEKGCKYVRDGAGTILDKISGMMIRECEYSFGTDVSKPVESTRFLIDTLLTEVSELHREMAMHKEKERRIDRNVTSLCQEFCDLKMFIVEMSSRLDNLEVEEKRMGKTMQSTSRNVHSIQTDFDIMRCSILGVDTKLSVIEESKKKCREKVNLFEDRMYMRGLDTLVIGDRDRSTRSLKKLIISDFPKLRSIIIGNKCFSGAYKFELFNCPVLETLKIGDDSFHCDERVDGSEVQIHNCLSLQSIVLSNNVFLYFQIFAIESISKVFTCHTLDLPLLSSIDVGKNVCRYAHSVVISSMDCIFSK